MFVIQQPEEFFMAISNLTVNRTFQGPFQERSLTQHFNSELLNLTCSRELDREWSKNTHQLLIQSYAAAFKTPVGNSEDGKLYFDTVP